MADVETTIKSSGGDYASLTLAEADDFGCLSGSITAFADGGGGTVTVTSAAHGLTNGDSLTISGTTNYNDSFSVSGATTNTFDITTTWVSDDATGAWDQSALCEYAEDMTDTDVAITTTVPSAIEISVQSAYRHDGRSRDVSGSGVQISSSYDAPIRSTVDNLTIDGIELKQTTNGTVFQIVSAGAGSDIVLKNSIVHNTGTSSSSYYVILATVANINLTLENVTTYGVTRLADFRNAASVAITNCTFWGHNDQLGIIANSTLTCNHTYCGKASGTQQDFWTGGTAPTGAYNAASDTSVETDYTNSLSSKAGADQFEDVTSGDEDFTLVETGSLDGAGSSTATYTSTDIIGTTRDTSTPSIGAFEYESSSLSIELTGTVTTATESDIVSGGQVLVLTLDGDTWVAAGDDFNAQRQNIIDGLDSAFDTGATGTAWNAEVRDKLDVTQVVRTSNTVVTITL